MQSKVQPPAFIASEVKSLPRKGPKGIARVHNSRIDRSKTDTARFHRHQAVVIKSRNASALVVRSVAGTPDDLFIPLNGIGLDYDALDALRVNGTEAVEVEVRPANSLDLCVAAWKHPDPVVRVSMWFGVFGAVTGLIGVVGMIF